MGSGYFPDLGVFLQDLERSYGAQSRQSHRIASDSHTRHSHDKEKQVQDNQAGLAGIQTFPCITYAVLHNTTYTTSIMQVGKLHRDGEKWVRRRLFP